MTDTATTPTFIKLHVETLEDLHTGSGTGGGDIDALLQRDRDGRPVIRASHLKGLLREAGEELIAFGALTAGDLRALLGTEGAGRGALHLTSLRLRDDAESKTLIWGSTQRVEHGRAPQPDTLRFIEHVAAGTRFEAVLRLGERGLQPLLERLLNRIDRIGGARNRGGGLVKLSWSVQSPVVSAPPPASPGERLVLRMVLRNLEPLCLPATGHPGNLIKSHSFIRGQALRGALMAWAIHNGHGGAVKLFERLSVGDALPLPTGCKSTEQVLPIPMSILTEKPVAGDLDIPWWAGQGGSPGSFDSLYTQQDQDHEKPKRPGTHEYLCRSAGDANWQRYSPAMRVRLRNATPKRISMEDTRLFSLEEIAEDTCFQAEVRGADPEAIKDFLNAVAPVLAGADWLAIGRGGAPARIEAFSVAAAPTLPPRLHDDWTLTLTSDAIVRGERLGFLDNLSCELLCQLAGIEGQDDWKIVTDAVETTHVHGFNAVTGLTRAPALALRRGSCWRIAGPGSAALARALLGKGALGERTGEGFGRFVIGVQPIDSGRLGKPPGNTKSPQVHRNEELLAQARELARKLNKDGPSLSQLQWLRSQAMGIDTGTRLQQLLDEIAQAHQRRPQGGKAWQHFPHQRLRDVLDGCQTLDEQRRLIAYLVQWRVPAAKKDAANKEALS